MQELRIEAASLIASASTVLSRAAQREQKAATDIAAKALETKAKAAAVHEQLLAATAADTTTAAPVPITAADYVEPMDRSTETPTATSAAFATTAAAAASSPETAPSTAAAEVIGADSGSEPAAVATATTIAEQAQAASLSARADALNASADELQTAISSLPVDLVRQLALLLGRPSLSEACYSRVGTVINALSNTARVHVAPMLDALILELERLSETTATALQAATIATQSQAPAAAVVSGGGASTSQSAGASTSSAVPSTPPSAQTLPPTAASGSSSIAPVAAVASHGSQILHILNALQSFRKKPAATVTPEDEAAVAAGPMATALAEATASLAVATAALAALPSSAVPAGALSAAAGGSGSGAGGSGSGASASAGAGAAVVATSSAAVQRLLQPEPEAVHAAVDEAIGRLSGRLDPLWGCLSTLMGVVEDGMKAGSGRDGGTQAGQKLLPPGAAQVGVE